MVDSQFGGLTVNRLLEEKARAVAGRPLSAEERREQRISFVLGMVGAERGITRDFVEKVIDRAEEKSRA